MKVFLTYHGDDKIYKGRLLGLIDAEQFGILRENSRSIAKKVKTGKSMDLEDIVDANCKNMRLVLEVKDDSLRPSLLVSTIIDYVKGCTYTNPDKKIKDPKVDSVEFFGVDGYGFMLEVIQSS